MTFALLGMAAPTWAQTPIVLDPPAGTLDGVNVINGSTVIVQLRAPGKDYVHLRGDFNGWTSSTASLMRKSVDGNRHWIQVSGLSPGTWYRYHFMVEGNLEIGDPYAELVLDPWNDQYIPQSHYPGMPAFPSAHANWHTSAFRTDNPYSCGPMATFNARRPTVWSFTRPWFGILTKPKPSKTSSTNSITSSTWGSTPSSSCRSMNSRAT